MEFEFLICLGLKAEPEIQPILFRLELIELYDLSIYNFLKYEKYKISKIFQNIPKKSNEQIKIQKDGMVKSFFSFDDYAFWR